MKYKAPIRSLRQVHDLRDLAPDRRQARVLKLFGGLARGEGFVFVDERWPDDLLTELQHSHWGQFEWYPLEQSPKLVRIALSRRTVKFSPLRQLVAFMSADHRRIELMLLQIRSLAAAGRWRKAGRLCGYMETGLLRHMQMEEELLLPLLMERARTHVDVCMEQLREEHLQLLQEVRLIQASAFDAQSDLAPALAIDREIAVLASGLMRSFFAHERNEQQVLYAPTDLVLDEPESAALVQQMQQMQQLHVR
jgi:uncharacterized protein (DUF2249 family)